MTLEELLKSQGIDNEQVTAILNAMKENKIYTASEENLDLRYGKLKTEHDSLVAKDAESQKRISDLQKATKGQEEIQNQIADYKSRAEALEEELQRTKIDSAIKVGLLAEDAEDVEYLTFKLKEKLKEKEQVLELDESGNIKGWAGYVEDLKTQLPNQFSSKADKGVIDGFKPIKEDEFQNTGMTKKELLNKSYPERMKFYSEHPEEYAEIMKG